MEGDRPVIGFVLSLAAGVLILADGFLVVTAGGVFAEIPPAGAGSTVLVGIGFLGMLFGIVVLGLAWGLYSNPGSHVGYGIAILILSLISIITGGGFLVGLVVGTVGGILGIIFEETEPLDPFEPRTSQTSPRFCPNCASPLASSLIACPFCDTRLD